MPQNIQLQQAVLAALRRDPSVDADHIGVTVNEGVATLTGHAGSFAAKRASEAAALRVRGVRAVADEVEVKLPFDFRRTDEDLADAAISRLAWNVLIPLDAVKVGVEKGWLTLSGRVEWRFQKDAAEEAVRPLIGVVGVSNEIEIKPKVSAEAVSDDIVHALHRSWFFDPKTITVAVEDGRVRLGGTVRSPHERQVAAATAWAEPGVVDVANLIEVV
jgi:osmotically-inducible protein OsmY